MKVTVHALGTVVNILFIEYEELLLIQNKYVYDCYSVSSLFLFVCFLSVCLFLILVMISNGNRVSQASNRPCDRQFRGKIIRLGNFSNFTMQLNHRFSETSLTQAYRYCRQCSDQSDNLKKFRK